MEFEKEIIEWSFASLGGGESLAMQHPRKEVRKKPNDAQKKEKVLEKLVHAKTNKGYNAKECRFVDKSIKEEYSMCSPFGHNSILDMTTTVERFK